MSLIMVQDAREKKSHHNNVEGYCKKLGIPIIRKMLNVGDYRLANLDGNGNIAYLNNIAVDVKGSGKGSDCGLLELANDLYRDKQSFNRKYRKCLKDKVKLIVLVEQEVKSLRELVSWKSTYTKITGRELLNMIETIRVSYGVDFRFCDKKNVGESVIALLQGECK